MNVRDVPGCVWVFMGVLLLVSLFVMAGIADAATYCVDDTGGATNACNTSAAGDCSDVTEANREGDILDAFACISPGAGDTLIVFPGTYTEGSGLYNRVPTTVRGTSETNRTIIKAQDPANKPVFKFGWHFDGRQAPSTSNCVSIANLLSFVTVKDITWDATPNTGLLVNNCAREILLDGVEVNATQGSHGVTCFGTSDRSYRPCNITGSRFTNNAGWGAAVQGTEIFVEKSFFSNNRGIQLTKTFGGVLGNPVTRSHLRFNHFELCTICMRASGHRNVIYGNLFDVSGITGAGTGIKFFRDDVIISGNTFYEGGVGIQVPIPDVERTIIERPPPAAGAMIIDVDPEPPSTLSGAADPYLLNMSFTS